MPLIALYRPGPLNSGMVDEFIKRKNNPDKVTYETPLLEGILKDTYGVIIYQEQIMKIASVLANFSLKDADILRKAMSKKIPEELAKYREQFIEGAKSNRVSRAVAEKIYDVIVRFGEYGFNKSHSTAYGLIAYQTAYLKAHYPVHYFAGMLTNEVNDTDKMIKYITECRDSGIEILPPDINKSAKAFTIIENKIRFGLSGVKNVGDAAIDSILLVRDEIGEFNSFAHFMNTVDSRKANKKVLESLAKGGCFDSLGLKRSQILHLAREKSDKLTKKESKNGLLQMDMFGTSIETTTSFEIPDMEELSHEDLLNGEKESLGFYFSKHPLKPYEHLIRQLTPYDSQNLKETDTSEDVTIAGIVNAIKEITTKRGDRMAYLTLEDTKGIVEVIVFPDLFAKDFLTIKSNKPIIISGSLEKTEDGSPKIKAKTVSLLDSLTQELGKTVKIKMRCESFTKEDLKKLRDILNSMRGNAAVLLEFQLNGEKQSLKLPNVKIDYKKKDILFKHFTHGVEIEVIDETLS
jgi:DNA polymerase-3 subunit alpha